MKKIILVTLAILPAGVASAQNTKPSPNSLTPVVSNSTPATASDVEALRQQVQSLTETVKTLQQQVKDQQAALEKANLTGESGLPQNPEPSPIAGTENSPTPTGSAPPRFPTEDTSVVSSTTAPAVSGTPAVGGFPTTDTSVMTSAPETISTTGAGASLTQPITIGGGKNYMNISLDGLFALAYSSARDLHNIEVGDHDPQQRGFNARNTELAFDGAVDPYFEGFANIVFKLDNDNETEVEVEEAFMQTTSLPFNLQLKGGQFFAAFGRLNPTHPHTWDFVDTPLVNGLFLGPDGLRGVGAQTSWTLPLPWYSQLIFASQNGRGSTGFSFRNPGDDGMFFDRITTDREARGLQDFVWIPRFENSLNLSDTQTVLAGVSGAFGSNEDVKVQFGNKYNTNAVVELDQTIYDQALLYGIKAGAPALKQGRRIRLPGRHARQERARGICRRHGLQSDRHQRRGRARSQQTHRLHPRRNQKTGRSRL